jgi:pimeloyl-ACP methyl ester carboxylesterase
MKSLHERADGAPIFSEFESALIKTDETEIFVRNAGRGPAILFLHGFPQTHIMWRRIAPAFATTCSVVCADLRGYGASGKPPSTADHTPYTKRAMALDMIRAMSAMGFDRFSVVGHDRGGRVAYRMGWTIRTPWNASRSLTSSPRPMSSAVRMRDLLWRTGLGPCWRSRHHCLRRSWLPHQRPLSRVRWVNGVPILPPFPPTYARNMWMRFAPLPLSMPSVRSTAPLPPSIARTMTRIDRQHASLSVRCSRCGAWTVRWTSGTQTLVDRSVCCVIGDRTFAAGPCAAVTFPGAKSGRYHRRSARVHVKGLPSVVRVSGR